jgi:hypothetical protein
MEQTIWRVRSRWENNIKLDIKETEYKNVAWNHLAPDRVQWRFLPNTIMNFRVL